MVVAPYTLAPEHRWSYGKDGNALVGKKWMNAISCGGSEQTYSSNGLNRFTIRELLVPFEQTARLCNMQFIPPFVVHGTHRLTNKQIEEAAIQFRDVLTGLADNSFAETALAKAHYMNDLVPISHHVHI